MSTPKKKTARIKRRLKIKEAPTPKEVNATFRDWAEAEAAVKPSPEAEFVIFRDWAERRIKSLTDSNASMQKESDNYRRIKAENEQLRYAMAAIGNVLNVTYKEW
jgi:hypothetical protein